MTGIPRGVLVTLFAAGLTVSNPTSAQQPASAPPPTGAPFDAAKVPAGLAPPKTWTVQQDHQDMMDRLGIKALRPGPSGNESAPNHANYDEALANPYPNLPDVLTLKNDRSRARRRCPTSGLPDSSWPQTAPKRTRASLSAPGR